MLKGLSSASDIEDYFIEKKVSWFRKSNLQFRRMKSFLKINVFKINIHDKVMWPNDLSSWSSWLSWLLFIFY